MGNDFKDKRQRKVTVILFGAYLLMLIWIVVFKLQIPGLMGPLPHIRGINLIPFYYSRENELHLKEVLYNVVVFIPFGIYSGIFLSDKPLPLRLAPACFASLIFESTQFVFHIGASDITDLITNSMGSVIGILVYFLLGKIFPNKKITLINIIGTMIAFTGLAIFVLTIAENI